MNKCQRIYKMNENHINNNVENKNEPFLVHIERNGIDVTDFSLQT